VDDRVVGLRVGQQGQQPCYPFQTRLHSLTDAVVEELERLFV
jgi:hypothetical protein